MIGVVLIIGVIAILVIAGMAGDDRFKNYPE